MEAAASQWVSASGVVFDYGKSTAPSTASAAAAPRPPFAAASQSRAPTAVPAEPEPESPAQLHQRLAAARRDRPPRELPADEAAPPAPPPEEPVPVALPSQPTTIPTSNTTAAASTGRVVAGGAVSHYALQAAKLRELDLARAEAIEKFKLVESTAAENEELRAECEALRSRLQEAEAKVGAAATTQQLWSSPAASAGTPGKAHRFSGTEAGRQLGAGARTELAKSWELDKRRYEKVERIDTRAIKALSLRLARKEGELRALAEENAALRLRLGEGKPGSSRAAQSRQRKAGL